MRLPEAKIELAASTEESRYLLKAVKLDVPNKRIMATDGHILAIVPCEVSDGDTSALLSLDSIKMIRAAQKRAKGVPVEVHTNGVAKMTAPGETAEYELVTGQFPNVDMVIPKGEAYEGPATVTLNVDLLLNLAKALGSKNRQGQHIVSLRVRDRQSGVLVKTSQNPDAIGVIMPCRD